MTSRVMGDCAGFEHAFSHTVPQFWGAVISTSIVCVGLLIFNWQMGIALLWVAPVSFAIVIVSRKWQDKLGKKHMGARPELAEGIQECLETVQDIKACNQEEDYLKKLDAKMDAAQKAQISSELATASLLTTGQMFLRLGLATVIVVGNGLIMKGQTNGFDITFDHVKFSYEKGRSVLQDVSFTAKQGQVTALVGPSGGGKSTIAKLLAGFYDPTEGEILYRGTNLKNIPFSQLMEEVSFVSQDNYLFDMSIMENIRIGRKEAADEEVIEAAKLSGCHDFIMKLENGYDTRAGDVGKFLSGGERQRITIARAMMKPAKVIILDEATAYVDPENEQVIQQAIGELVKDKMLIVIAHRLSTIVNAEKIVVVRDGNIEAEGTQQELLDNCPLYRNMWQQHVVGRDSADEMEGE